MTMHREGEAPAEPLLAKHSARQEPRPTPSALCLTRKPFGAELLGILIQEFLHGCV